MFFAIIDEITLLQQNKRKRLESEDNDLNPPLTIENLKSQRSNNPREGEGGGHTEPT